MEKNQIYNMDCEELIGRLYAEKLRGGVEKYLIVTDPPFNVGYHYD